MSRHPQRIDRSGLIARQSIDGCHATPLSILICKKKAKLVAEVARLWPARRKTFKFWRIRLPKSLTALQLGDQSGVHVQWPVLVSTTLIEDDKNRAEKNPKVQPDALVFDVFYVQARAFIEIDVTSSVDLPQPGNSW